MASGKYKTVLFDAHVHIYPVYDLVRFFTSAFDNFAQLRKKLNLEVDYIQILGLTESLTCQWFSEVDSVSLAKCLGMRVIQKEAHIQLINDIGDSIYIIVGRQINSSERIEVSALGIQGGIEDNLSLETTVEAVLKQGGVPVLPWGFGKWFGKRGRMVSSIVDRYREKVYLSDNSNRLQWLPLPREFLRARKLGVSTIAGSDTLPIMEAEYNVARYVCVFTAEISDDNFVVSLMTELRENTISTIKIIGQREGVVRFLINQTKMQLKKA